MQCIIRHLISTVSLLLAIASLSLADELKSQDIYKQSLPSVMTLKVLKSNGDNVLGTGFMAVKEGMAVTAWHVVRDAKTVTAKFSDGQEFESSGLVDKDEKRDIALIRVKVFGKALLPVATTAPDVGSPAYVIGAPEGLEFSITSGLLSQIQVSNGINHYQFSCPASPGNSGGPLFNVQGQVTGVVSFQLRDGQNLNFAVPSTYVLGLDATLPTLPWGSVKETVIVTPTSGAGADDDLDKLLGQTFVTVNDLPVAMQFVYQEGVLRSGGFKSGVPVFLYTLQGKAKEESEALSKVATTDALRQRLATGFQVILVHDLQAVDLMIDGIHSAQSTNGWAPAASDSMSRSLAVANSGVTISPEDVKLIVQSPAFSHILPADLVEVIRRGGDDGTGFQLGNIFFLGNMLGVLTVPKDSLADKLGLKSGDQLISAQDVRFASLSDFKRLVKANAGHEIKVTLFRNGKQQEIKMKVPDKLPK